MGLTMENLSLATLHGRRWERIGISRDPPQTLLTCAVVVHELHQNEDPDGEDADVQKSMVGAAQRFQKVQEYRVDHIHVQEGRLRYVKTASVKRPSLTATMKNEMMKVQTAWPHPSRVPQPSLCINWIF